MNLIDKTVKILKKERFTTTAKTMALNYLIKHVDSGRDNSKFPLPDSKLAQEILKQTKIVLEEMKLSDLIFFDTFFEDGQRFIKFS